MYHSLIIIFALLVVNSHKAISQLISCDIKRLQIGNYEITNLPCIQDSTKYGTWIKEAKYVDQREYIIDNKVIRESRLLRWYKLPPTKPKIRIYNSNSQLVLEGDIIGADFKIEVIDSAQTRQFKIAKSSSDNGGFSISNIKYNFNNILGGQLELQDLFKKKGAHRYLKIVEDLIDFTDDRECQGIIAMQFPSGLEITDVSIESDSKVFDHINIKSITPVSLSIGACDGNIVPTSGKFAVKNVHLENNTGNQLILNKLRADFSHIDFKNLEIEFSRISKDSVEILVLLQQVDIGISNIISDENPIFMLTSNEININSIKLSLNNYTKPLVLAEMTIEDMQFSGDLNYYRQIDIVRNEVLNIDKGKISMLFNVYSYQNFDADIQIENFDINMSNKNIQAGRLNVGNLSMNLVKNLLVINGRGKFSFTSGNFRTHPKIVDITTSIESQNNINLKAHDRGDELEIIARSRFGESASNFSIENGMLLLDTFLPEMEVHLKSNTYSGNFYMHASYTHVKKEIRRFEEKIVEHLPWPLDDIVKVVTRTMTVLVEVVEDYNIHMNITLGNIDTKIKVSQIKLIMKEGKTQLCNGTVENFDWKGKIYAHAQLLYVSHKLIQIPDELLAELTQPVFKKIGEVNSAQGIVVNNILNSIFQSPLGNELKILGTCD